MSPQEESGVRQLVIQTMDRLRRASASPQDLGSRYARLLELLWQKPKPPASVASQEQRNSDIQLSGSLSGRVSEPGYMQFSPANDFSWLDLEAVGDYVSGDQMAGANVLTMNDLQVSAAFAPQPDHTTWQPYNYRVDLNGNLLF